ncbi:hypothetical protein K491DRAFT_694431 [Lophiostoma macrostomum CBS 122681]|uniref:Uncharacterized protein n=1 Tax=Lophiostoma macrostomum CBS 122681 TaxID=1314788 RepID=A0A6A6T5H4_9PLEO|nr:hypothetical protein K491DRAFT_694431 [Lophiostoma macrostomum CBS 122681]
MTLTSPRTFVLELSLSKRHGLSTADPDDTEYERRLASVKGKCIQLHKKAQKSPRELAVLECIDGLMNEVDLMEEEAMTKPVGNSNGEQDCRDIDAGGKEATIISEAQEETSASSYHEIDFVPTPRSTSPAQTIEPIIFTQSEKDKLLRLLILRPTVSHLDEEPGLKFTCKPSDLRRVLLAFRPEMTDAACGQVSKALRTHNLVPGVDDDEATIDDTWAKMTREERDKFGGAIRAALAPQLTEQEHRTKMRFAELVPIVRELHRRIYSGSGLTREERGELCIEKEALYEELMDILIPTIPLGPLRDQVKERLKVLLLRPEEFLDYDSAAARVFTEIAYTPGIITAMVKGGIYNIPTKEQMIHMKVSDPSSPCYPTPWYSLPNPSNGEKYAFVYSAAACPDSDFMLKTHRLDNLERIRYLITKLVDGIEFSAAVNQDIKQRRAELFMRLEEAENVAREEKASGAVHNEHLVRCLDEANWLRKRLGKERYFTEKDGSVREDTAVTRRAMLEKQGPDCWRWEMAEPDPNPAASEEREGTASAGMLNETSEDAKTSNEAGRARTDAWTRGLFAVAKGTQDRIPMIPLIGLSILAPKPAIDPKIRKARPTKHNYSKINNRGKR